MMKVFIKIRSKTVDLTQPFPRNAYILSMRGPILKQECSTSFTFSEYLLFTLPSLFSLLTWRIFLLVLSCLPCMESTFHRWKLSSPHAERASKESRPVTMVLLKLELELLVKLKFEAKVLQFKFRTMPFQHTHPNQIITRATGSGFYTSYLRQEMLWAIVVGRT